MSLRGWCSHKVKDSFTYAGMQDRKGNLPCSFPSITPGLCHCWFAQPRSSKCGSRKEVKSFSSLQTPCQGGDCKWWGGLCSYWSPHLSPKPVTASSPDTAGFVFTDNSFLPQQLYWCRPKFKTKSGCLNETNASRQCGSQGCFSTINICLMAFL